MNGCLTRPSRPRRPKGPRLEAKGVQGRVPSLHYFRPLANTAWQRLNADNRESPRRVPPSGVTLRPPYGRYTKPAEGGSATLPSPGQGCTYVGALWSLSFANTFANIDKQLYVNDTIEYSTSTIQEEEVEWLRLPL